MDYKIEEFIRGKVKKKLLNSLRGKRLILKEIFRVKLVRIHAIFREKKNTFSKKFFRGRPITFGSLSG